MRKVRILGFTLLVLLLFTTLSFGSLTSVVPDSAVLVMDANNADSVIDYLYSDQIKSMTGGELDIAKAREDVKNELGFDALDPEFLKGLFSNGMTISITGFTQIGIPEVLVVLSPKNKMSFLKFVKAVEDKTGLKEEVVSYKGINITRLPIPDVKENEPKELAWSMFGNYIVFGLTAAPVKDAIEVFKGERPAIDTAENYIEIRNKIKEKLGDLPFFFYLATDKFATLFEILKSKLPEEQAKSLESSIATFSTMRPMGFSGVSTSSGFRAYGLMGLPDMYVKLYKTLTFPKLESLNLFPKNTFFYLGGVMPLSWEKIKDILPPAAKKGIEDSFAQLKNQTGMDIEKLFLSWLDKELAVGVFDPSGMIPKVGLILGYTNQDAAWNAINTLASMAGPALGAQPQDKEYEGIKYKAIENPMFPVGAGFVKDRLVVASGIENIIDASSGNMVGLAKKATLGEALSTEGLTSIIYIDFQAIVSIIERFAGMGGGLDDQTKKALDALKKVKDIVFWSGYDKGMEYSFMWLKVNNAQNQ